MADILPVVSALADAVGARVRLLQVVPEHGSGRSDALQAPTDYLDGIAASLQNAAALVVSSAVRHGEPAAQIVEEIRCRER